VGVHRRFLAFTNHVSICLREMPASLERSVFCAGVGYGLRMCSLLNSHSLSKSFACGGRPRVPVVLDLLRLAVVARAASPALPATVAMIAS